MIYFISQKKKIFSSNNYTECIISDLLYYFINHTEIQCDTETTGFSPHIDKLLTIQFGDHTNQFVVDLSTIDIELIKPIFNYDSLFLFQNAKFDLRFLYKHGITINKLYDTFLAELILQTGIDRDKQLCALNDIVWKYCNYKLDKSIRGNINIEGLSDRVIKYASEDVKYLSLVKKQQLVKLQKLDLLNVLDLENEVTKVFALMEYNGITLDVNKWTSVAKQTQENTKRLEQQLDDIVFKDTHLSKFVPKAFQQNLFGFEERKLNINWGSSQQKQDVLKSLGIIEDSTGERILQRNKHKHVLIRTLIDYNKSRKLNDAFGMSALNFINKKTGRIHSDTWQILSTGRISISNPNYQQIPSKGELGKVIRSAFIPQQGYKIVGGDFSGCELRLLAEFSQDPVWLDVFNQNKDLHSELCALTFNIPIEDVTKPFPMKPDLTYRTVQKTVNFGLAYGMSEHKLSDTIGVTLDEAKEIISNFFKAVPKVKELLDILYEKGTSRGYIRDNGIYKRLRQFPKWHTLQDKAWNEKNKILGEIGRASMNMPFQASNADLTKQALIYVQQEIDTNKWPVNILLQVHDEIVTECEEPRSREWCTKLNDLMVKAGQVIIKSIPVIVDTKVSDYWSK